MGGLTHGVVTKVPIIGCIGLLITFLCSFAYFIVIFPSNCILDIISRRTYIPIVFMCTEGNFSYITGN